MPVLDSARDASRGDVTVERNAPVRCRGILNSLATAEALAGLIANGSSPHVDLRPFDPARFQRHKRLGRQYRTTHR